MNKKPFEFDELMLRAMNVPEEVDIRGFELIPFSGKLHSLIGIKNVPSKMVSIKEKKKKRKIQVFYVKEDRKAYVQVLQYEKYKEQIDRYFSEKIEIMNSVDIKSNNAGLKRDILVANKQNDVTSENKTEAENAKIQKSIKLSGKELKEYLVGDFGDHKYRRKSIIEIYLRDKDYFNGLRKAGKINLGALRFIDLNADSLNSAYMIPTEAFRNLKYAEIVDEYIKEPKKKAEKSENTKATEEDEKVKDEKMVDNLWKSIRLNSHKILKEPSDNRICVKDFVVKGTTFKCMNRMHRINNIDGIIDVIDDSGKIIKTTIPAGYCPYCNVFFIVESTYQNLKMRGTPVCRISDEKTYSKTDVNSKGMKLAQESVLMQYGYTVSQQEGLSQKRRRKILEVIIDNNVLSKTDVISYLDFFINQRKHQRKYMHAVEEWKSDREFVSKYKAGRYKEYRIGSILKR